MRLLIGPVFRNRSNLTNVEPLARHSREAEFSGVFESTGLP